MTLDRIALVLALAGSAGIVSCSNGSNYTHSSMSTEVQQPRTPQEAARLFVQYVRDQNRTGLDSLTAGALHGGYERLFCGVQDPEIINTFTVEEVRRDGNLAIVKCSYSFVDQGIAFQLPVSLKTSYDQESNRWKVHDYTTGRIQRRRGD